MQLDYLKNLPLLYFETFPAGACEISFVEFVHIGVLEISGEVASRIGKLVRPVSDQQVVASSEGRPVPIEAANCLVFEGFDERVLGVISNRKDKGFPFEICFEMRGISMKVVFPAERREPSDNFIVLSEADGQRVVNSIANLVEFLDAEAVVAGPVD